MPVLLIHYGTKTVLISHNNQSVFNIREHQEQLERTPALCLPLNEELELLDDLSQFELGQFLLNNKGLNGYWTAYVILYSLNSKTLHPLEHWLIHHAPGFKATRERFKIFQEHIQSFIEDNWSMASIPGGLMDDLFSLDYSNHKNISLTGIDLDEESLSLAAQNANKYGIKNVSFIKKDAWNLEIQAEFNLITSNGLNIYEPDDAKVIALYQQFSQALKTNGILITSFITPPPLLTEHSTWRNYKVEDMQKQKALFNDIIQANWQTFRTEAQTRSHLEQAGFEISNVIYDSQGIFPTVIARKKANGA